MAKAEGIPPTASVASVGPGIRYVGNYAYAYSGFLGIDDNVTALLETTSGAGICVGTLRFFYPESSSDNFRYRVKLNGEFVAGFEVSSGTDQPSEEYINIILPPFTEFLVTAQNAAGDSSLLQCAVFTGRVYDV